MGKVVFNVVLPTKTKMFCGCPVLYDSEGYRLDSYSSTCPVCRREKGAYPILNKKAVEEAIAVVLAFKGTVTQYTLFDRVRDESGLYDYISQYSYPIGKDGCVEIAVEEPDSAEQTKYIDVPVLRLKEAEEEKGIPVLEILSGPMEEEQNPYYIEEVEKVLLALGMEEWEIIETDQVIETIETQKPVSYLPDPDIPPVIISQWWVNQIAARYPELIHIDEPEVDEEDDF